MEHCKYKLRPAGLMYHLRPLFPYSFSVWIIYPLDTSGALKLLSTTVLLTSPLIAVNICLIYCGAPVLGMVI